MSRWTQNTNPGLKKGRATAVCRAAPLESSKSSTKALVDLCDQILFFFFFPLQNVHILPQTVLYMADSENFINLEECRDHKRARKRTTMEAAFALEKLFPKQCQVLGIATPGILVTPIGSRSNRPQEIEIGEFVLLYYFLKLKE